MQDRFRVCGEKVLDLAVVAGALATLPLTFLLEEGFQGAWLQVADWTIWTVFLLELLLRILWHELSRRRLLFLVVVVIISFPLLPAALGLVRVVRLSRLLRLARVVGVTVRGLEEVRAVLGRESVLYVGAISALVILSGAAGIAMLEPQTVHGGFADGIWWAIVTATTVGYGDIAPTTFLGRAIAVLLMFTGVGLISTLSASITTHLLGQQNNAEQAAMKAQLDRLEQMVSALRAGPGVGASGPDAVVGPPVDRAR